MEWAFVVVLVLGIPIALAIWLITRAISAKDRIDTLSRRIEGLELEIHRLKTQPEATQPAAQPAKEPTSAPAPAPSPIPQWEAETTIFLKTPLPPTPAPTPLESASAPVRTTAPQPTATPPPIPSAIPILPKLPPVSEPQIGRAH